MKILDFIVCDDIRDEISSKVSLIGMYHDRIKLQYPKDKEIKWPIGIRVGFFLRILIEKQDKFDALDFSIFLKGLELVSLKGEVLSIKEEKIVNLKFVIPNLKIESEGTLDVSLSMIKNGEVVGIIKPDLPFEIEAVPLSQ